MKRGKHTVYVHVNKKPTHITVNQDFANSIMQNGT